MILPRKGDLLDSNGSVDPWLALFSGEKKGLTLAAALKPYYHGN